MRDDVKWSDGKINQTAVPTDTYDSETLGVKALDDSMVQFTLEAPAAYFPSIAGLWQMRAVPSWTIEQYGDAWTDPKNIVTNGPYKLAEWYYTNTAAKALAEALQATWKENLGVNIRVRAQDFPALYASTAPNSPVEEAPELWIMGWIADYPDENNWVNQVLHCTNGENHSRATCTQADGLATQASRESDPEKRKELYKQIEQMMIGDEVRIAPIVHFGYSTLTKPFIERSYPTFGSTQWEQWKIKQ